MKDRYRSEISSFIDSKRAEMKELLCELVSIPSVRGVCKEGMPYGAEVNRALRRAEQKARELGLSSFLFEGMMTVADLCEKRDTMLAIVSHLDVVPADAAEWSTPPFTATEKGDLIYGRGTSDNKAPTVAALYALYAVKTLGIPLRYNARLIMGGSEENECTDFIHYLKKYKLPKFAFTPDAAFPVGYAERGRIILSAETPIRTGRILGLSSGDALNRIPECATVWLCGMSEQEIYDRVHTADERVGCSISVQNGVTEVRLVGKSAHACGPETAINPITAALTAFCRDSDEDEKLVALSHLFPHMAYGGEGFGIESGRLDLSLTKLQIKDGIMTYSADGRVNTDYCSHELAQIISDCIPYQKAVKHEEPHRTDPESETVRVLQEVYCDRTGRNEQPYIVGAKTYAHCAEGMVAFGARMQNDGSGFPHSSKECCNINTMTEAAKIFADAIVEICGADSVYEM